LSSARTGVAGPIDAVQSGPVKKLTVDIEDTAVPGGPSGQVSVRILRPKAPGGRWR
jgi:acetyl esterase